MLNCFFGLSLLLRLSTARLQKHVESSQDDRESPGYQTALVQPVQPTPQPVQPAPAQPAPAANGVRDGSSEESALEVLDSEDELVQEMTLSPRREQRLSLERETE